MEAIVEKHFYANETVINNYGDWKDLIVFIEGDIIFFKNGLVSIF